MGERRDLATADGELATFGLYINGHEVPTTRGTAIASVNPATGRLWATIADASVEDVGRAVDAASRAFLDRWRCMSPTRRGRLLMRLGDLVLQHAEELAALETRENGKLYKEMLSQLRVVPDWLYYYGGLADKVEGRVIPLDRPSVLNYTLREPLGVIGVITPWNSPTLLALMSVAPALAAGNTVVVKPSEVASASMVEIAKLGSEAGLPPGVLNVVTGGPTAGQALSENDRVAKVAFTGGAEAGRQVAVTVAIRHGAYMLELGGKSANIVFDDADLDAAEAGVLAGIYGAAGQTCVAGSRALIHESVLEEMQDRLAKRARAIRLGDPMQPGTEMGPIATDAQLARIIAFVEEAVRDGGSIVTGGDRAAVAELPDGLFYQPTIVANVKRDSRLAQEEVFGPVLALMPFRTEQQAIELANGTRYGLAAGVWTRDIKRGHRVARQLEAGTVWINLYRAVTFNSPFGGYKQSGLGRLNGIEGIGEFLQTKSVWCELSDETQDPFVLRT